jgi:hypothetical protein
MAEELIVGNTYPVREQLKAMGGRWDPARRGWVVPADQGDAARALVASAPVSPRSSGPNYQPQKSGSPKHGQLWQECERGGCRGEPVCSRCFYCGRHCAC